MLFIEWLLKRSTLCEQEAEKHSWKLSTLVSDQWMVQSKFYKSLALELKESEQDFSVLDDRLPYALPIEDDNDFEDIEDWEDDDEI